METKKSTGQPPWAGLLPRPLTRLVFAFTNLSDWAQCLEVSPAWLTQLGGDDVAWERAFAARFDSGDALLPRLAQLPTARERFLQRALLERSKRSGELILTQFPAPKGHRLTRELHFSCALQLFASTSPDAPEATVLLRASDPSQAFATLPHDVVPWFAQLVCWADGRPRFLSADREGVAVHTLDASASSSTGGGAAKLERLLVPLAEAKQLFRYPSASAEPVADVARDLVRSCWNPSCSAIL